MINPIAEVLRKPVTLQVYLTSLEAILKDREKAVHIEGAADMAAVVTQRAMQILKDDGVI